MISVFCHSKRIHATRTTTPGLYYLLRKHRADIVTPVVSTIRWFISSHYSSWGRVLPRDRILMNISIRYKMLFYIDITYVFLYVLSFYFIFTLYCPSAHYQHLTGHAISFWAFHTSGLRCVRSITWWPLPIDRWTCGTSVRFNSILA